MPTPSPSFNLAQATKHLAERDECLKRLIAETMPFQMDQDPLQSPYEALLEAIAYQSISGKAAATIYGRVKILSGNGRAPTPQEMLKLRKPALRKAGLSGAKILAMKDLAQKSPALRRDRKSTRLNSSHQIISYAVFCLKKKNINTHA